jgi:hypothetical protein
MSKRAWFVVALTALAVAVAMFAPPIAQPVRYHDFADHRALFGIANFGDVASNFAFLVAGIAGLVIVVRRHDAFGQPAERWPYAAFFFGLVLTAVGSAYYHAAPDKARLVWDRLPMTVAFAGLVCGQIADRVSVRAGVSLVLPAIVVGATSVFYWRASEAAGHGNLVPYGVAQAYAMILLVFVVSLWPSRYTRGRDMLYVFGLYAIAKICEALDRQVFDVVHVVSGHTLKHLFAALAGFAACAMLAMRVSLSRDTVAVIQSRAAVSNAPASIPR